MTRARVLVAVAAALALLCLSQPAWAHVTITAPGATRGGSDQQITFRVPVEKNVDTVGVTIALPTDTPIASVLVDPIAGWTHTEKVTKLAKPLKTDDGDITSAVSEITWTASAGHGLKPGEYGSFTILAGQLPDVPTLTFKALQRYSDGTVVKWIEVAAPGSTADPENPAPMLSLAPASSSPSSAGSATKAASSSNTGATVLAIVALVVAAGALGLSIVTRAHGRRT